MKQTFVAIVEKTPGLIARVDALFRRQDAALESLTFAALAGLPLASITVVAHVPDEKARLLVAHLRRLVDVRDVLAPKLASAAELELVSTAA
jgi:acetolactate synthase small subunit